MLRPLWDWTWGSPAEGTRTWEWSDPYSQFRSSIDRLIDDFGKGLPMGGGWGSGLRTSYPPICLWEDHERYTVEAELPGVSMGDLEITCTGRNLTLRGERKDAGDPEEIYQRSERPTGTFARMIELPGDVEADKVNATLKDGILEITVPKSPEARPRRIEVRQAGAQTQKMEANEKKEA